MRPISCANGCVCKFNMRATHNQVVPAVCVECPVLGCSWQRRRNKRRHYEQHDLNWSAREIVVLTEAEGPFQGNKMKSRCTRLQKKHKCKKMCIATRSALLGDKQGRGDSPV